MKSLLGRLLLLVVTLGLGTASQSSVHADVAPAVCPKCGKIHGASSSGVVQASATMPQASLPQASAPGVTNVLSALNAQRARNGVGQLGFDPQLQVVAERRALQMARTGRKSHPPGSFAPGRYEGVGWSSSYSPSGVSACYTSDSRMRVAGAAMATGRDGVYFAVVYR
ncbi:MAG: CAP domain-containing protein [Planctomycetaceae bacterium]